MEAAAAPAVAPVAAVGAATTAPAVSPQYTPPPPPMMPQPAMAEGGSVASGGSGGSNKFKEFFSDINLLEVAISAFIIGGVLYSIHYFKFMMMLEKTGYADLNTRIQRLESQMSAAKKSAEANATGNGKMGMSKKRALITL